MQQQQQQQHTADSLLALDFEVAVREFEPLRKYLESQGDARNEVEEEFRTHWHSEAPAELRQVIDEIIDPALAAESEQKASEFLENPLAAQQPLDVGPGQESFSAPLRDVGPGQSPLELGTGLEPPPQFQLDMGRQGPEAGADLEQLRVSQQQATHEDEDQGDGGHSEDRETAESLLSVSFDEALRRCPALKQHIDAQPDAKEVEEEFRNHWDPVAAPPELRQVLDELLDPALAEQTLRATEEFLKDPLTAVGGDARPGTMAKL